MSSPSSIYDFDVTDIDGNTVNLGRYRDKVCIIVNVASQWGLTRKNYTQLQAMYTKYADAGLRILAFPCNQFGNQEPGTDAQIKESVQKEYHVTFDLFHKIDVNGSNAIPLYKYLTEQKRGILNTKAIKWNFTKFLIDRNGKPVYRSSPQTEPDSMLGDIRSLLDKGPSQSS